MHRPRPRWWRPRPRRPPGGLAASVAHAESASDPAWGLAARPARRGPLAGSGRAEFLEMGSLRCISGSVVVAPRVARLPAVTDSPSARPAPGSLAPASVLDGRWIARASPEPAVHNHEEGDGRFPRFGHRTVAGLPDYPGTQGNHLSCIVSRTVDPSPAERLARRNEAAPATQMEFGYEIVDPCDCRDPCTCGRPCLCRDGSAGPVRHEQHVAGAERKHRDPFRDLQSAVPGTPGRLIDLTPSTHQRAGSMPARFAYTQWGSIGIPGMPWNGWADRR